MMLESLKLCFLYADSRCSLAQKELEVGRLPAASCRPQAKCWINTGCVWRLVLLYVSFSFSLAVRLFCIFCAHTAKPPPLGWPPSHHVAAFQKEVPSLNSLYRSLSIYLCIYLSISSPFLPVDPPVSGLGGSVTFYPWATRAQPLTLAWSLTSSNKPRPQVKVCISEFSFMTSAVCLCCGA